MANPFNFPRPADVTPEQWETGEAFANTYYEDIPGAWIEQWITEGTLRDILRSIIHQQWTTLQTPVERWLYLWQWRLDTLIDRGKLEGYVKNLASIYLSGGFTGIIPTVGEAHDNAAAIADSLDAVERTSTGVIGLLGELAATLLQSGTDTANAEQSRVLNSLDTASRAALSLVAGESAGVLDTIGETLRIGTDTLTGRIGRVIDALSGSINTSSSTFDDLVRRVLNIFDGLGREGVNSNQRILDLLDNVVLRQIGVALDRQTAIDDKIGRRMDQDLKNAEATAKTIEQGIDHALEEFTRTATGSLETTRDVLAATGQAQVEATEAGSTKIAGAIDTVAGAMIPGFAVFSDILKAYDAGAQADEIKELTKRAFGSLDCKRDGFAIVEGFVDELFGKWTPLGILGGLYAMPATMLAVLDPVLKVIASCYAQAAAQLVQTALHSPAELREMVNLKAIPVELAVHDLQKQGYSAERIKQTLALRRRLPDIGFIQTWYLRGFISGEEAAIKLGEMGLTADDSVNMLKMAFFIPPVQDLITMAVREVFDPATAQRFGQFEDFPPAFAEHAIKQGVSSEWSRNYWAAHWRLPSAEMGFEMAQRRVAGTNNKIIGRDDLNKLLKALDIMPFWRERLTHLAFRPLTRVDLRRMFDLKLIDRGELRLRYEDLGYAPPDAELMTKFTEEFTSDGDVAEAAEIERLTRATVEKLYKRGVFNRDEAKNLLKAQGIGANAAEIFMTAVDVDMDIAEREDQRDLILDQAKADVLTVEQAQDRLVSLGLTHVELQAALTKLQRQQAQTTQLPSVDQLSAMLKAKIIDDAQALVSFRALGYSLFWSERLIKLTKV